MALIQGPTTVSSSEVTVATEKSGRRINVKSIRVRSGESSNATVTFRDGTGGTTLFVIPCPPGGVAGIVFADDAHELGRLLTAGNALTAQAGAAATTLTVEVEFGRV